MRRGILSFFPPIPRFISLSAADPSISSSLLPRLLGRSLGRQCSRRGGWGDGGWTDRKHLSPITTEENHIIWVAWHFSWGRLICPSHSSIHLVMMSGHLSHSRQRAGRKNPRGSRQAGMLRVCEHVQFLKYKHVHSHIHTLTRCFFLLLFKVTNNAVKLTLSM